MPAARNGRVLIPTVWTLLAEGVLMGGIPDAAPALARLVLEAAEEPVRHA